MKPLPERPHLDHLRAQAKDLLHALRQSEPTALARVRESLPAAHSLDDRALAALPLRLHDAQSCVAREYGFASWSELRAHVEMIGLAHAASRPPVERWLRLAYALGFTAPKPRVAARLAAEWRAEFRADPVLACAVGDVDGVRVAIANAAFANAPIGPLGMPPLVAVTFSSLVRVDGHAQGLRESARALLAAGADPDARWTDPQFPGSPLSALYGAAGRNHDAAMTSLLLEAGADPNDNESVYHATEAPDMACLRLLLAAGARVDGTNALFRVLDEENLEGLQLLLSHGADVRARNQGATLLRWAIRRRRSPAVFDALLAAGADPREPDVHGRSLQQQALRAGLIEVAERLRAIAGDEPHSERDRFVGACSSGDVAAARAILAREPRLLAGLDADDLRLLPDAAAAGRSTAVRAMVELGWPIATRGGDWNASALNLAVFRGDPEMVRFLLDHGASWLERHGYDHDARGTLSFACTAEPIPGGDWLGCAEVLLEHGMPVPTADDELEWSDEIAALFAVKRGG